MRTKILAAGIIMLIITGCATFRPSGNSPTPVEQTGKEAGSRTEAMKPSTPNEAIDTLTPDEISGAAVDGEYYIESINTKKTKFRIPEEINGAPVVSVSGYMFAVSNIETVIFPDSMEYIGEAMFNACDDLTDVELGKNLKYIGSMAFNGCGTLETVSFPEGTETFEDIIFYNCKNLKKVYVPASVTGFGNNTPVLDPKTCPDAVVVTPAGSPAEKICTEKGVPVQAE